MSFAIFFLTCVVCIDASNMPSSASKEKCLDTYLKHGNDFVRMSPPDLVKFATHYKNGIQFEIDDEILGKQDVTVSKWRNAVTKENFDDNVVSENGVPILRAVREITVDATFKLHGRPRDRSTALNLEMQLKQLHLVVEFTGKCIEDELPIHVDFKVIDMGIHDTSAKGMDWDTISHVGYFIYNKMKTENIDAVKHKIESYVQEMMNKAANERRIAVEKCLDTYRKHGNELMLMSPHQLAKFASDKINGIQFEIDDKTLGKQVVTVSVLKHEVTKPKNDHKVVTEKGNLILRAVREITVDATIRLDGRPRDSSKALDLVIQLTQLHLAVEFTGKCEVDELPIHVDFKVIDMGIYDTSAKGMDWDTRSHVGYFIYNKMKTENIDAVKHKIESYVRSKL